MNSCAFDRNERTFFKKAEEILVRTFMAFQKCLGKSPVQGKRPPQRILITKSCCMGDAILSLYALREYKKRFPECEIDVLATHRVRDVYADSPFINRIFVLPVSGRRTLLEILRPGFLFKLGKTILELKSRDYDELVDFELYHGYGVLLKAILGIPLSRGFLVQGTYEKNHDQKIVRPKDAPEWKCYFSLLELVIETDLPQPLYPSRPCLPALVGSPNSSKRIGIVFGSSFNWPQKKWPCEYFSRLLTLLAKDNLEFVLFGSAFEIEESRAIASGHSIGVTNTTGTLDYGGLKLEISRCALVVGNDTGTMHLAAACGVQTLTLFGPTNPEKWNPLTSLPLYLESIPCRPCYYLSSMPSCTHFSCLRQLMPERVAEGVREVLGISPV